MISSFVSMENFVAYVQPWLPDYAVRLIVWLYLSYFVQRLRRLDHPFKELRTAKKIMAAKDDKLARVADKTSAANEQHYEVEMMRYRFQSRPPHGSFVFPAGVYMSPQVPTEFFTGHLGPCRKYSSCEWENCATLAQAETATFDSYLDKMSISDVATDGTGAVLEVGCGWGSFLLYAAAKHPSVKFVGFSNSATQQAHIAGEAERKGLSNVTALRLDINDFCDAGCLPNTQTAPGHCHTTDQDLSQLKFDRIFSCECLEHSKDYGSVFVQILCHREYTYFMNNDDWMGRNFFTGGTM